MALPLVRVTQPRRPDNGLKIADSLLQSVVDNNIVELIYMPHLVARSGDPPRDDVLGVGAAS